MPTYYARKSGNINAADVWATTPTGTASNLFPTFTNADVLVANTFNIDINVSTTAQEIRNDAFSGATAGGLFRLLNGVTLSANVFVSGGQTVGGLQLNVGGSGGSATIVGNINGLPAPSTSGVYMTTGTLNIVGNITNGAASNADTLRVQSSGGFAVNVTGNINGTATGVGQAVNLQSDLGSFNVTGNITGGTAIGVASYFSTPITITGNVLSAGTQPGISNTRNALIVVNGVVTGGPNAPGITMSTTGGLFGGISCTRITGNNFGSLNSAGITGQPGISNTSIGNVEFQQLEYGSSGQSPTSGTNFRLKKVNTNVAVFNYCDTAGAKTLVDATQGQMPAASDVRHGISYASGALTGTCRVPAAASVAFGVQVDATTGTAYLSQSDVLAAVWGAATSSLTTAGSIGERLKNAATVATTGEQLATALTAP